MVSRKGIGYIIEAMTAMLVMFVFIIGNSPSPPQTDWSKFQKEVIAQDLSYVMEKTGDMEDIIKNGETGTLVTAASELSRERVRVSGTIENVPINTQVVGFHTLKRNRKNISFAGEGALDEDTDQCYDNNDLEEIEPEDGNTMRSTEAEGTPYLYIADTDPEISGGNGNLDYDSVWVDNGTRCQFSASEGPYYLGEFFFYGDTAGHHYDINDIYESDQKLELFNASQVVDLKNTLNQRMNGIDTGSVADTVAVERGRLNSYDILVFRQHDALSILNSNKKRIHDFMSKGSVLLMMDLKKTDFYKDLGSDPKLKDNFITSTGLKWINLDWKNPPSTNPKAAFSSNPESERLQTFFRGLRGEKWSIDIKPSGNISSSNTRRFRKLNPFLSTNKGSYSINQWNSTNYTMNKPDPDNIEGFPTTACVDSDPTKNLTKGIFKFHDYQTDSFVKYEVINTKLGENQKFCEDRNVRALNIDLNNNNKYGDSGEGPFLNGEKVIVENKTFIVNFPNEESLETGKKAEFVYVGENRIETVNYRTSFPGFNGQRLARMGYKADYNPEEEKIIASIVFWLSDDTIEFGTMENSDISTEIIAGVKEETFVPYKISMRWK